MQIFGFWGRAVPEIVIFFARGNSLSQNLTVLTAPSGREPLARPETFRFSRKLCRYAKGPILEGAVERSETGGVQVSALSSCIYHIFIDNKPHFAVN